MHRLALCMRYDYPHSKYCVKLTFSLLCKAYAKLENGDLYQAFLQAKSALELSENAFFDPSVVAMLYFPEDHKYAIYTPLFFPISLPILVTSVKLFQGWRSRRKIKSA